MAHAPETACLPLKINLGNFVEALERGADTIIMGGGWGPCRFGYYAKAEEEILRSLGFSFDMLVLEAPDGGRLNIMGFLKRLQNGNSLRTFARAVRLAWHKLNAVDRLEQRQLYYLPRSIDAAACQSIYRKALKAVDAAQNKNEAEAAEQEAQDGWQQLLNPEPALIPRIGLVGEIYTLLEPAANGEIMTHLGRMGVEVVRPVTLSQWMNDHIFGGLFRSMSFRDVMPLARPYLNYFVGGHGCETVACAALLAREQVDGVIQIGPLTCMPEIVAQAILPRVQEETGVPIMTVYFDEHAGEAGLVTRLEAFTDMVRWRDQGGVSHDSTCLSWH